jgi:hypothetical protein
MAVSEILDHESTSAPRRDIEQLSSDAGAQLLRALGVKGHEAELRSMPEKSWSLTKVGLARVVSSQSFECWASLTGPLTKACLEPC